MVPGGLIGITATKLFKDGLAGNIFSVEYSTDLAVKSVFLPVTPKICNEWNEVRL